MVDNAKYPIFILATITILGNISCEKQQISHPSLRRCPSNPYSFMQILKHDQIIEFKKTACRIDEAFESTKFTEYEADLSRSNPFKSDLEYCLLIAKNIKHRIVVENPVQDPMLRYCGDNGDGRLLEQYNCLIEIANCNLDTFNTLMYILQISAEVYSESKHFDKMVDSLKLLCELNESLIVFWGYTKTIQLNQYITIIEFIEKYAQEYPPEIQRELKIILRSIKTNVADMIINCATKLRDHFLSTLPLINAYENAETFNRSKEILDFTFTIIDDKCFFDLSILKYGETGEYMNIVLSAKEPPSLTLNMAQDLNSLIEFRNRCASLAVRIGNIQLD